ncbi:MAG: signal peptide peptidase SppA [Coriobacteriia bacterium]|nr:signal peptide peptidase SppA [Coriobacteriia bacterium]
MDRPNAPSPAGETPVTDSSAVAAAPAAAPSARAPEAASRQPMSRGAKWALGLGAALVVLGLLSCVFFVLVALSEEGMAPLSGSGDGVALIYIDGVIAGTGSIYDGVSSPSYILDQLDQALADESVRAILLRIDSPGGTVAASQEISLAVRRAAEEKPVVASIGDIGASGAYMVASQCDEIVASPGSSVGSIGVIMEIPNVSGLLDKLGVEFTVLTEGEYKDAGSPYRSVTESESAMLKEKLAIVRDQFIADVAEGRGMPVAEVAELATGWVWLGSEAIDLGLIDTLGNFDDAIDAAADLGGIEGEPYLVTYESEFRFEDLLWSMIGLTSPDRALDADALRRSGLPR